MQAEGPDVGSILTIWDDVSDREVLKDAEYHKRPQPEGNWGFSWAE